MSRSARTRRAKSGPDRIHSADGAALVVVLGAMLVLSAMGLTLALLAISQTYAAGNQRRATAALYAAEAGLERALPDLLRAPDWDVVLDGRVLSGFTDGPPAGTRVLPDGFQVNLGEIVALANCGVAAGCTEAQMNAVTEVRPWGPNNPRWRLFAYGPLAALLPGPGVLPPAEYLVVLVADDTSEADGDALHDGRPPGPGAGVVQLRAEALGPESAHRAVEITVARGAAHGGPGGYAGQRGQGTTGGPGTAGDVQVPGDALARSEMTLGGGLNRQ